MLASEFLDLLSKYQTTTFIGADDFADRLSFLFSTILLVLAGTVIGTRTYLFAPLSCYTAIVPTNGRGSDGFQRFLLNECWVEGTGYLHPEEKLPFTEDEWKAFDDRKMHYYQWVPFILGIQAILFYLPHMFWQLLATNPSPSSIDSLLHSLSNASHTTTNINLEDFNYSSSSDDDDNENNDQIIRKSRKTKDLTSVHAASHYLANVLKIGHSKPPGRLEALLNRMTRLHPFGRQTGGRFVFFYFLVKLLYLTNAIGQLFLMRNFLSFRGDTKDTDSKYLSLTQFSIVLGRHLLNDSAWKESYFFPRTSICRVKVRVVAAINPFISQCVLSVNMLSEKLYIFLWFWTILVILATGFSILLWWFRVCSEKGRVGYIRKLLMNSNIKAKGVKSTEDHEYDPERVKKFLHLFLCHDGIFIIRMLSLNLGDIVASSVVKSLWTIFIKSNPPPSKAVPIMNTEMSDYKQNTIYNV